MIQVSFIIYVPSIETVRVFSFSSFRIKPVCGDEFIGFVSERCARILSANVRSIHEVNYEFGVCGVRIRHTGGDIKKTNDEWKNEAKKKMMIENELYRHRHR